MATAGFTIVATAAGPIGLVWGDAGILGVQLPEASEAATRARVERRHPLAVETDPPADVQQVVDRMIAMLADRDPTADPAAAPRDDLRDVRVDLTGVGDFDRRVYDVARGIAPGRTMTYGEVGAAIGDIAESGGTGDARAVGQALGRNPVPLIVPCHRVLAAGGRVGGFSAPGGVTTKLRLLALEDATHAGQPALF
jgi:methylated-DNA-[protein]-cysteine S-methyltransferase